MYLENLVFDASEPQRLGGFWREALGGELLSDEPGGYEFRLVVPDSPTLDLCFQRVPEPPAEPVRLHLDLSGGRRQSQVVDRLLSLGARHLDIGQGDVAWVVLADPEGNAFCVLGGEDTGTGTGPIASVPIDAVDPAGDARFWSWLTGWVAAPGADRMLRHPSGRGLTLEFCPEPESKPDAKNRLHLDVRLEPGDDLDRLVAEIKLRGGAERHPDWGELPWRTFGDPSGNEFCVLPARP